MVMLALLSLWMVPLAVFPIARRRTASLRWCATGIALGLVAMPASTGLYSLYWFAGLLAPYLGWLTWGIAYLGIGGLALSLMHGAPGYYLATEVGLVEPATAVRGWQHLHIALVCALVWAPVYGAAGLALDWTLTRKSRRRATR
jgi:hypothetical protein